jgi:hypothetical protein
MSLKYVTQAVWALQGEELLRQSPQIGNWLGAGILRLIEGLRPKPWFVAVFPRDSL